MRLFTCALALLAGVAAAQPASLRVDVPFEVPGALAPEALTAYLQAAGCEPRARDAAGCSSWGEPSAVLYETGDLAVSTYVAFASGAEATLDAHSSAPEAACANVPDYASREGDRWTWEAYGQYSACAAASAGREIMVGRAQSQAEVDSILTVLNPRAFAALPAQSAFVHPISRRIFWSREGAVTHAVERQPLAVRLAPPEALAALLPASVGDVAASVTSGRTSFDGDGGPRVLASYAKAAFNGPEGARRSPDAEVTIYSIAAEPGRTDAVHDL